MDRPPYDRLSFLDESFLLAETPRSHMHVAGTAIYEAGPLRKPDGGIDIELIREYVESRLGRIPRYRQIITHTPIENHPVWVDDPDFNIHYHVRHSSLPRPGDERQLKRLSARIMSQQLDRSRPLWEMWVIEGLEGGDRFAIVTKVHHCMIDGMSSVDLLETLLTPEPLEKFERTRPFVPRPLPTAWDFLRTEIARRIAAPFDLARDVGAIGAQLRDPRSDLRVRLRALRGTLAQSLRQPSNTPLNRPIGPHRRFDWLETDVARVKRIKNALGGSLNDVVLAAVTLAVQRFLESRRVSVEGLAFRVMAPVSVRTAEEKGTLGNRVSAWMIDLPIAERDPRRLVERICHETTRLKDTKQALGASVLTEVVSWTPSTLLSVGARMMTRALPFNLVVTNVPGPQVPLYLLGARMREQFPMVPLTDQLALGIALFSYAGKLCWGFNADWNLLPDLHDFVIGIEDALDALEQAAA